MAHLLALGSAVLYGAADFLGGLAARQTSTIAVVFVSQAAGIILLGLMLPLLPEAAPSVRDFIWGGTAGLAGGTGVALLYRGLAVGRMAVVAPITALCAVVIPVVVAMLLGERPTPLTMLGIASAVVAIFLVSRPPAFGPGSGGAPPVFASGSGGAPPAVASGRPRGVGLALLSGVAIGFFFLALARTGPAAGLWPLVAARLATITFFGAIVIGGSRSLRMPASAARTALAAGGLDMLANVLYLLASRFGPLSEVVTLSSLYPVSTVVLAGAILGEHPTLWQVAGIMCALAAVVLIVGTGA